MHKLLYYPDFEIQDQNFLKFALLYIDEISPIIPYSAINYLSKSMRDIINSTDLIRPYQPNHENGFLASEAAIKHLEEKARLDRYKHGSPRNNPAVYEYTLYAEKYTYIFENYCLENNLGQRCDEGILLDTDTAYVYMSILAEIISKEKELDMITDVAKYSDPSLRRLADGHKIGRDRFGTIQKEIEFFVPVDMRRIPLERFIELRSNPHFERSRRAFVTELNAVLDAYDQDESNVDLYNVMKCKQEIYRMLKELFFSCAAIAVGVHSWGNMRAAQNGTLDFWGNAGNVGISLDALKQHSDAARCYAARIEEKRQARKYLAILRKLYWEVI